MDKEDLHILRLMGEIDRDGDSSQRELSYRLNLSLGLVNTFLKRLVKKGYFKAKTMPRNRLKYFLTPEGLTRKSRLTVDYLQYSLNFYRDIKQLLQATFREMEKNSVKSIIFYGSGEVADLAYLYLQETKVKLVGILDQTRLEENFFGFKIHGLSHLVKTDWDMILLTRLDDVETDIKRLLDHGVRQERIATI